MGKNVHAFRLYAIHCKRLGHDVTCMQEVHQKGNGEISFKDDVLNGWRVVYNRMKIARAGVTVELAPLYPGWMVCQELHQGPCMGPTPCRANRLNPIIVLSLWMKVFQLEKWWRKSSLKAESEPQKTFQTYAAYEMTHLSKLYTVLNWTW